MTLWLVRSGTGQMAQGRINGDTAPCPTIMAEGLGGGNCSQYWLEDDEQTMPNTPTDKPPYRVPSMAEIAALPWNGLSVASTFSGAGGSCLGWRLAGYRVLWANEFVPAAQDSYKANAAPGSILDCRDITQVQPEDILQATGLAVGELDVFEGSPPCQAFSTAGKRAKGWGQDKTYEHGAKQKNETLFTEYIRLLRGLQPKVFVAENVSGLVKGVAKGYFKDIFRDLQASGYRVEARLLDAQWLGVPQMRQRIIFVGVQHDLGKAPAFPQPLAYRYSVRDALPWINDAIHDEAGQWSRGNITESPAPTVRSARAGTMFIEGANGFNGHAGRSVSLIAPSPRGNNAFNYQDVYPDAPCGTVTIASPGNDLGVPSRLGRRKFTITELKRICAFPDDFILTGSYSQQWARMGNAVPPVMMKCIAETIRQDIFAR